jgi:hypothetical protein
MEVGDSEGTVGPGPGCLRNPSAHEVRTSARVGHKSEIRETVLK